MAGSDPEQQTAWDIMSADRAVMAFLGRDTPLPGFNLYVLVNNGRLDIGLSMYDLPRGEACAVQAGWCGGGSRGPGRSGPAPVWNYVPVGSLRSGARGASNGMLQDKSRSVNSSSCIHSSPPIWVRRADSAPSGNWNFGA